MKVKIIKLLVISYFNFVSSTLTLLVEFIISIVPELFLFLILLKTDYGEFEKCFIVWSFKLAYINSHTSFYLYFQMLYSMSHHLLNVSNTFSNQDIKIFVLVCNTISNRFQFLFFHFTRPLSPMFQYFFFYKQLRTNIRAFCTNIVKH